MKIAWLCTTDVRVGDNIHTSVKKGIENAGHEWIMLNPNLLYEGELDKYDAVISNGYKPRHQRFIDRANERDQPYIIYDLGYIKRASSGVDGYFQVGFNRLGWLPDRAREDRKSTLDVDKTPSKWRSNGFVLVAAQKFNDGQHGMNEAQMRHWAQRTCKKALQHYPNVKFRPHPRSQFWVDGVEKSTETDLDEALEGCAAVITYNSTLGLDAILRKIPVIAEKSACHYSDLITDLSEIHKVEKPENLVKPTFNQLQDYLSRLSYAQWTREEIETGQPFTYLFNYYKGVDHAYTDRQPEPVRADAPQSPDETPKNLSSIQPSSVKPETNQQPERGHKKVEPDSEDKVIDDFVKKHSPFFTLRSKVKQLTGVTAKNSNHAKDLLREHMFSA